MFLKWYQYFENNDKIFRRIKFIGSKHHCLWTGKAGAKEISYIRRQRTEWSNLPNLTGLSNILAANKQMNTRTAVTSWRKSIRCPYVRKDGRTNWSCSALYSVSQYTGGESKGHGSVSKLLRVEIVVKCRLSPFSGLLSSTKWMKGRQKFEWRYFYVRVF